MLGLDISTNENYTDGNEGLDVWGIVAVQVYDYNISYNTLVDEKWTGNEQRRAQWTYPRRSWTLEFEKDALGAEKFEKFFQTVKGKFKAFKFKWSKYASDGSPMGGDDKWYYCRFNSDDLKCSVDYYGYRTFQIEIIELRSGV